MMRRSLCLMLVAVMLLLILPAQPAEALPFMDNHKQELAENVARQIVAGMPSWVDTDEEKVVYLHNYLVATVTYEHNSNDQTAYGALILQRCVCAGYARGLALLLNTAGIEAGTKVGWPMSVSVGHEWTYFYLNGIKLYADATWSDCDFTWKGIQGQPAKAPYYSVIMTEKRELESHAEYIFLDGIYDGSGSDAGTEYYGAKILERNGVPVGHFNQGTTPEEILPYIQVLHYEDGNALIRIAYYYENEEGYAFLDCPGADQAAAMFLDSVEDYFYVTGDQCESYYWGPLANYTPVPAQGIVLRTTEKRETRVSVPFIVTAEVYPYEASNKRVIYTSSDPSVATVDSTGRVMGISEGKVVITATSVDGGYTDSVEVTIVPDHYHENRLQRVDEIEPTCEEPGWSWYFICSCGTWFETFEPVASMEIKDHSTKQIPALGHQESGWMYDANGHWKQCTRGGCGKVTQEKTAHSDGDGNGTCDTCAYQWQTTVPTTAPTEPTTVPVPTTQPPVATEPTTVPVATTEAGLPTMPTTQPTTSQTISEPTTQAAPTTTPQMQQPESERPNQWILWVCLPAAVVILAGFLLVVKKKK